MINGLLSVEMKNVYERLGVSIIERGESFYQPLMPKIVADFEKKGVCMIVPAGQLFYIYGKKGKNFIIQTCVTSQC